MACEAYSFKFWCTKIIFFSVQTSICTLWLLLCCESGMESCGAGEQRAALLKDWNCSKWDTVCYRVCVKYSKGHVTVSPLTWRGQSFTQATWGHSPPWLPKDTMQAEMAHLVQCCVWELGSFVIAATVPLPATSLVPYLPAFYHVSRHDNNGLNLWTLSQSQLKVFLYKSCSGHSNRNSKTGHILIQVTTGILVCSLVIVLCKF